MTVGTIIAGLEKYLEKFQTDNPSCRVEAIKSAEILSDESKNKQLDVAKAIFTVEGQKIEVDLMPTIGEETYGTDNRVPIRDERGTLKQDALRRDLTIGALLIKVSFCSEQQDADGGVLYAFEGHFQRDLVYDSCTATWVVQLLVVPS